MTPAALLLPIIVNGGRICLIAGVLQEKNIMFDQNNRQVFYQEACNRVRQHETLLMQRLNYFLIAIAFLVAAFVQLTLGSSNGRVLLAFLVGTAGILLSWAYTTINYYNAKNLKRVYVHAMDLEYKVYVNQHLNVSDLPQNYFYTQFFESGNFKAGLKLIFVDCLVGSVGISFNNKKSNDPNESATLPGPHTWIIPYCFIIFWLLALLIFICTLTPKWGLIIVGLAIFYFLIFPLFYRYIFLPLRNKKNA
jgi:hypothetical protein